MAVLEESEVLELLSLHPYLEGSTKEQAEQVIADDVGNQEAKGEATVPQLERTEA